MTSFTTFYIILEKFHFQGAFIIFLSFSMCIYHIFRHFNILFLKELVQKNLNNYLMLNLTHGFGSN
jgi:hypothetical protein